MFITVTESKSGHRPRAEVQSYRVTWQESAFCKSCHTDTFVGLPSTIRGNDKAVPFFYTPGTISSWLHSSLFPLPLSTVNKVSAIVLKDVTGMDSPRVCHLVPLRGGNPGRCDLVGRSWGEAWEGRHYPCSLLPFPLFQ